MQPSQHIPDMEGMLTEEEFSEAKMIAAAPVAAIGMDELASRYNTAFTLSKCRQSYWLPIENISIRDGFNVRYEYGDIEDLATGIAANNYRTDPLDVDLLADGTVLVTDGHRRLRAYQILVEQGHEIGRIECFINERETTEEERIISLFVTQNNKQLRSAEIGACFMRLQNSGWSIEEIATRIGRDKGYVYRYLHMNRQPAVVKRQLLAGLPEEEPEIIAEENTATVPRKRTPNATIARIQRLEEIKSFLHPERIDAICAYLKGGIDEKDLITQYNGF